jgi:aryl-alcohol dehydrogenase-like predicted oxidoreductase
MRTMPLGKTNETFSETFSETISAIGYGGMPLSIQGRPAEEDARLAIHAAVDAGMTFIDTADVYCLDDSDIGHNERLIATTVADRPDRDAIRIATKAGLRRPNGAWTRDGSPKHIREACEHSLRMLGVEQIFLYQFHAPDEKVPFEKSLEAFAELQREGTCKYVGVSNVSLEQLDRAAAIVDVVSVQNRLNPYFRESVELARECGRRGVTFLAYSPVGGGRLTKKIPKFPVLQEIAKSHDATPHAVTIAWVRAQGETVVPIPGGRDPKHIADSAGAAELELTADEIAAIDQTEFSRD